MIGENLPFEMGDMGANTSLSCGTVKKKDFKFANSPSFTLGGSDDSVVFSIGCLSPNAILTLYNEITAYKMHGLVILHELFWTQHLPVSLMGLVNFVKLHSGKLTCLIITAHVATLL